MASNAAGGNKTDAQSYESLVGDVVTYGSVCLALAMTQETGIISLLCKASGPLTSADVAQQCKLKERYVREVLSGLAVAGLIDLEAGSGGSDGKVARYLVPQDRRDTLTHAAASSGYVSVCARHFAALRDVFDVDGPNGFRYAPFMFEACEEVNSLNVENFTEAILKTPGLRQRLENGIDAIEVGCGYATVMRHLAAMFPKSRFTITDVVPGNVDIARQRAQAKGLRNVTFRLLDVMDVPNELDNSFDWALAVKVIHDLPRPLLALQGVFKTLRPGGHFSVFDLYVSSFVAENVGSRHAAVLYSMSPFMCIPESYQEPHSVALGPCWGEQKARDLMQTAGFRVLGMASSKADGSGDLAVCMCEKPE